MSIEQKEDSRLILELEYSLERLDDEYEIVVESRQDYEAGTIGLGQLLSRIRTYLQYAYYIIRKLRQLQDYPFHQPRVVHYLEQALSETEEFVSLVQGDYDELSQQNL